jgi:hypothetical protein|tara:strand:+ start:166 stop:408 length:243 start_codon:yes stop_codon:yes gene_type:complete
MKLSKKQLEELRTVIQGRDEAFKSVGALEMRKSQQLNEAYDFEMKYSGLKVKLKEKYGDDVQIDMSDGTIVDATNNLKKA